MLVFTLTIVLTTYAGVAVGYIPRLGMNRATIALVGAATLIAVGALSEDEAIAALDISTILLLGAMMIINNNLRLAGFFELIGGRVLKIARTPRTLLALVILASGVLSALFLNDTICLMFAPLVTELTLRLRRDPIPYLIGLATATNIGSTATITGNPQNLIIGQASDISYLTFAAYLTPVALMGLLVCWIVIIVSFRHEFRGTLGTVDLPEPKIYTPLLNRTLMVVVGLLLAFLVGLPIVSAACVAAGLLLVSRLRPAKLLELDWGLLAFFGGLFVVTGAIEATGLSERLFDAIAPVMRGGVAPLSLVAAALSNMISNVPAVLLLRSEMDSQQDWLTLAMSSTLAGNLTLLGSAANLIVAESAARQRVKLTFLSYLKAGVPITLLTIFIGVVWLQFTA
ncbi:MAG: anion transporter [Anaerolineae bacterium]|nr:anion transporter [Anaerolineae bacterium]